MRNRSFVVVALTIVCLLAGAGGVLAYDSSNAKTIAKGVKVGGVDVGGLAAAQARQRLKAVYARRLSRPLVLHFARHRFTLAAPQAHYDVDVNASVQKALDRTRSANLIVRVFRSLTGGSINTNIDPQLSYSQQAVAGFVQGISRTLDRPPRNATLAFSGSAIQRVPSQKGLAVHTHQLTQEIEAVLDQGAARRRLSIPVSEIAPKVTNSQLPDRYPTVITINRNAFTLKLWKHLKPVKTYTIAVGRQGLETPAGLHYVIDKEVDPPWHVPNSSWAGSLAGQTIPYGPQDPLKARWIGFYDGDGIHGTDDTGSLGTAGSHGCIRMAIPDVIELYKQVPMGAAVFVA